MLICKGREIFLIVDGWKRWLETPSTSSRQMAVGTSWSTWTGTAVKSISVWPQWLIWQFLSSRSSVFSCWWRGVWKPLSKLCKTEGRVFVPFKTSHSGNTLAALLRSGALSKGTSSRRRRLRINGTPAWYNTRQIFSYLCLQLIILHESPGCLNLTYHCAKQTKKHNSTKRIMLQSYAMLWHIFIWDDQLPDDPTAATSHCSLYL